jgi:ectoine hydroxylase-related dioxygenase (phytanoyl-CoA dioxygenase family)
MKTAAAQLNDAGWATHTARLDDATLERLRRDAFADGFAGQRCLLDVDAVQAVARLLRTELIRSGSLASEAVAIQAIAFDKTPGTNWKVTWHQDLMFPFAKPVSAPGYDLSSVKDGVHYARPPREILDDLLAVRLHLDECDDTNGPLRVASGSHRHGIIRSADISAVLSEHSEVTCLAGVGDALLMKPLTLHASSPATAPKHRRVLHYVFHSGRPIPETWHRSVN